MIVIASHDNITMLVSILDRLSHLDLCGHDILVVNTNSQDDEYINNINYVIESARKKLSCNLIYTVKDYDCYDSGAYIHAFIHYDSDKYICLQDSLFITDINFISDITRRLDTVDVIPIYNFRYSYDNDQQRIWAEEYLGSDNLPQDGIFGPIFAVNKSIVKRIPIVWLKEPNTKLQACGMERRWSLIFHRLNATKEYARYIPHNVWKCSNLWNPDSDTANYILKIKGSTR
jgi:hypothetical protein